MVKRVRWEGVRLSKKLVYSIILVLLVNVATELILVMLYNLFFSSINHITFTLPFIHLTKFFSTGLVILLLVYRHIHFTEKGKYIFRVLLSVSIVGIIISVFSFNVVTEKNLLKYRVVYPYFYDWEDVDHVETKIYRDDAVARSKNVSRFTPLKVHIKYNIHLKNGASFNAWDNIDNVYELHRLVLNQHIDVQYNEMDLESFVSKYTSDFKEDMPKIKYIFYGVNDKN